MSFLEVRTFLFFMEKFIPQNRQELEIYLREHKGATRRSWWFQITRRRWFSEWKGINTTQRVIMLSLWLYAGRKGQAYPSMRTLARELELSLETIKKNIGILEEKKFIKIERFRGKFNNYILLK